jgi:hypothetical protein
MSVFGHRRRHGEDLGDRWKREDGELNVPPGRAFTRGDLRPYGVTVKRFSGGYFRNRHAAFIPQALLSERRDEREFRSPSLEPNPELRGPKIVE